MNRLSFILVPILLLLTLVFCCPCSYSESTELGDHIGEGPIQLEADRLEFDRKNNVYTIRGNAKIVQDKRILKADMIKVNPESRHAEATGDIILIDGEDILRSDRMEINMAEQTGIIYNGTLFFKKDNFHISGKRIEKLGKDKYRMIDGSFTTCDGDSPPWKFTGKELNVTVEGYATVKHAMFHLKDIPVFYFPYMIYPAKIKRQTGFLIPSVAYSKEQGNQMTVPFFWAISKNMDATFSLDYRGKRGIGEETDYRYLFSKNSFGGLYFYHMKEKQSYRDWQEGRKEDGLISSPDRWLLKYRHEQYFDPSLTAKIDATAVSDRDFYRDFDEIVDDRSKEKLESNIFLTKVWQRFNLNSEFRHYQDLEKKDKTTLQRLPRVAFTGSQQRIRDFPLFYSLTSAFDNFWREEGLRGNRIDIYPKILYTFHTDYFDFNPELGIRETVYRLDHGDDKVKSREIYDLNIRFSTTVQKIFKANAGRLQKLKHTIKPEVEYTFIPAVDQSDLPEFDSVDRIDRSKAITYSLTNELVGKIRGEKGKNYYHKFARFKLSQSYDFAEAEKSSADSPRPFSKVSGELNIFPTKDITLLLDGEYDTYGGDLSAFNGLLNLKNKRGDSVYLEYRNTKGELEEINTKLKVKVSASFNVRFENRYSIFNDTSSETIWAFEYKAQCWGIGVTYSDRAIEDEDRREQKYMVRFFLTGIGEFGE